MVESKKAHLAVIKREIDTLGIQPSSKERSLWLDPDFWWLPSTDNVSNNEESREIVTNRLIAVLDRMAISENPMFKSTALYLEKLIANERLRMRVPQSRIVTEAGHASMQTAVLLIGKRVVHEIQADPVSQLKFEDPITTAEGFVHEARHLRTNIRLMELYSSLDIHQAGRELEKYSRNPQNRVNEEAAAYEDGVWAYLIQRGLLWPHGDGQSSGSISLTTAYFHQLRESRPQRDWHSIIRKLGLHRA